MARIVRFEAVIVTVLFIVLLFLCFLFVSNIYADTKIKNNEYFEISEREINDYIQQLKDLGIDESSNYKIKCLKGFDDKEYILFEINPAGYFIFNRELGLFIEGSEDSISPYYNCYGNLLYGGYMNYAIDCNNQVINLFTKDLYSNIDMLQLGRIQNARAYEAANTLKGKGNEYGLNSSSSSSAVGTTIMVDKYTKISKLKKEFGYVDGGYCGYIAAAMLIVYNYHSKNISWLPTGDYLNWETGGPHVKLTNALISIGLNQFNINGGTYSSDIKKVVSYYCDYHLIQYTQSNMLLPSFKTIKSHITQDHAVIIFGDLPENPRGNSGGERSPHAVLCYGVLDGALSDYYYVHYGWKGYSNIMLATSNMIMGSAYSCW